MKPTACGSSPRMRGKLVQAIPQLIGMRLIPAYAGKTETPRRSGASPGAHPRVCGENDCEKIAALFQLGSSPRMRGKHSLYWFCVRPIGLIPAYAGKTPSQLVSSSPLTAHPRVCGENTPGQAIQDFSDLAHPRVCGENATLDRANARVLGSSPRMRGKPRPQSRDRSGCRLIPAYAGKTGYEDIYATLTVAHPRVCGENSPHSGNRCRASGSSPRMRGKPALAHGISQFSGLIPAYAGKTLNDLEF